MKSRDHRTGRAPARKAHGDLVRTSLRHQDTRRAERRKLREQEQAEAVDEFFSDYEGDTIWTD